MDMGISPSSYPQGLPHRAVYCNRTLNLRSIQARSTQLCHHMLASAHCLIPFSAAMPGYPAHSLDLDIRLQSEA